MFKCGMRELVEPTEGRDDVFCAAALSLVVGVAAVIAGAILAAAGMALVVMVSANRIGNVAREA